MQVTPMAAKFHFAYLYATHPTRQSLSNLNRLNVAVLHGTGTNTPFQRFMFLPNYISRNISSHVRLNFCMHPDALVSNLQHYFPAINIYALHHNFWSLCTVYYYVNAVLSWLNCRWSSSRCFTNVELGNGCNFWTNTIIRVYYLEEVQGHCT